MNCPAPSRKTPEASGVEDVIGTTAPAFHFVPPSFDMKIASLNVIGAPVQLGSLALISSAAS